MSIEQLYCHWRMDFSDDSCSKPTLLCDHLKPLAQFAHQGICSAILTDSSVTPFVRLAGRAEPEACRVAIPLAVVLESAQTGLNWQSRTSFNASPRTTAFSRGGILRHEKKQTGIWETESQSAPRTFSVRLSS